MRKIVRAIMGFGLISLALAFVLHILNQNWLSLLLIYLGGAFFLLGLLTFVFSLILGEWE